MPRLTTTGESCFTRACAQHGCSLAGNVFLKFCKLLHIKLDPIDPSLYIHRFASMLEFADKTQQAPPPLLLTDTVHQVFVAIPWQDVPMQRKIDQSRESARMKNSGAATHSTHEFVKQPGRT